MLISQAHYDLKKEREKSPRSIPNLENLRNILFWDTDINKIDWQKQSTAVIKRVLERGNDIEKKTILDFYGQKKIKSVTGHSGIKDNRLPIMEPHRSS